MKKYQTDLQSLEISLDLQGYDKDSEIIKKIHDSLKLIESYII